MDVEGMAALLRESGVELARGLTDEEVGGVEGEFEFRFPPDLRALLQYALPVSSGFPNWRDGGKALLVEQIERPLQYLEFDMRNNSFWFPDWGPKPDDFEAALEAAKHGLGQVPKLVPIYYHRFIPEEPYMTGNPVFSFWHFTDTIYYGTDLANYLQNEFAPRRDQYGPVLHMPNIANIRQIRFWSKVVAYG